MTAAHRRKTSAPRRKTSAPSQDLERLDRFLSRLDRRERLRPVLRGAVLGAALGLAGLLAGWLAAALGRLPDPAGLLLSLLAWALPLAGAMAGYRRPDLRRAAALGDSRARLHDLLKTAHGLEISNRDQEAWRPLLERRAAGRIGSLDAASLAPTPWGPIAGLAALLIACLLAPQAPGSWIPIAGSLTSLEAEAPPPPGTEDGPMPTLAAPEPEEEEPVPEGGVPPRIQLSAEQLERLANGDSAAGREAGEEGDSLSSELGDDLLQEAAAENAPPASDELLREVRRQLEEEGTLPSAAEAAEPASQNGGPTAPSDPRLQQQTDELTTIDAPTSAPSSELSRRSAGTAEVAVPAGVEVEAGDQPRLGAESGDPGAAEGGASTAPQDGFVDPLGDVPTELEVTLELALLESQQQEAARETTREMTPSRAGESTLRASGREPVAPSAESVPARSPVPWRHRRLVREYFDPSEPAARPPDQEMPPS
ncbi:MAG TPA: hypothetical protein VMT85_19010 [Thermoanaerobaculia bacterium]|nr:hypothetical protein [Thermoanaerobaculia bacterium]